MEIFLLRSVLKVITKGKGGGQKTSSLDYVIHVWSLSQAQAPQAKRLTQHERVYHICRSKTNTDTQAFQSTIF